MTAQPSAQPRPKNGEVVHYAEIPGCWNAWVEQGTTREERRERLERVPETFRAGVESHVKVAFAIRQRAAQKARAANTNHSHDNGETEWA